MNSLNHVALVGRLGQAAEAKKVGEQYVIRFSLALTRSVKESGEWVDRAVWLDVEHWARSGALAEHLTKGRQVALSGSLRQDSWEKDGQRRSKVVVVASFIQLLEPGRELPPGTVAAPSGDGFADDIPF